LHVNIRSDGMNLIFISKHPIISKIFLNSFFEAYLIYIASAVRSKL